jgi:poly-gamma-glutamate synthesis protein (capsule biosynthesis protein)
MWRLPVSVLAIFLLSCSDDGLPITFAGDILLDRGIRRQIDRSGIETLFSGVSDILHGSTFSVGNLECPLSNINNPQNKKYTFRGEPIWAKGLRKAGFTHLDVANNHTCDQGAIGFAETMECIKSEGIGPIGATCAGKDQVLLASGSDTCALFASNLVRPEPGEIVPDSVAPCRMGADDLSLIVRQYHSTHPKHFIIVLLHWGREHSESVNPEQRNVAHLLVDAGADIIVGHHPHVLQPIEIYNRKPIIYSLGNFVFDQAQPSATRSMLAGLVIKKGRLTKVRIFPIVITNGIPTRIGNSDFIMPIIPQADLGLFEVSKR